MNDTLIAEIRTVLSKDLPTQPFTIKSELSACMKLSEPLLSARVTAQTILAEKGFQFRRPKDKEYTDFDRKIMLEGDLAPFMANYELLTGLETLLGERIKVLSSLLLQIPQGSKSIA